MSLGATLGLLLDAMRAKRREGPGGGRDGALEVLDGGAGRAAACEWALSGGLLGSALGPGTRCGRPAVAAVVHRSTACGHMLGQPAPSCEGCLARMHAEGGRSRNESACRECGAVGRAAVDEVLDL